MKSEMTDTTELTSNSIDSQQLAVEEFSIVFYVNYDYSYFLKDHLGYTRMVLAQNGEIKQALMYQPYGTIATVSGIPGTGTDPLKDKFTTKELDEGGDVNGAVGIKAYYFGARYYDAEIGRWTSTDPARENWCLYTAFNYNPIIFVDPDGLRNTIYMVIMSEKNVTTPRGVTMAEVMEVFLQEQNIQMVSKIVDNIPDISTIDPTDAVIRVVESKDMGGGRFDEMHYLTQGAAE